VKAIESQSIWVDVGGNEVEAPRLDQDAIVEAFVATLALWLTVTGAGAGASLILRVGSIGPATPTRKETSMTSPARGGR
jgi:hypothetical protein